MARRILLVLAALVSSFALLPSAFGQFTLGGTQPPVANEVLDSDTCSGCHGDYDNANHIEPFPTWTGSMMAQAGRDPLFWAALDVANNDVPGIGEFCLRCHAPSAWLAGRFEPPGTADGCSLVGQMDDKGSDLDGVNCHFCHRMMVNPAPPAGELGMYLENGKFWIDDGLCNNQPCRRGPYDYPSNPDSPPHRWAYDPYFQTSDFCGNCHNVTSPVLNLIEGGVDTGIPFPIERTYAEWLNSSYGAPASADFTTCQGCHMPDATVDPAYACDQQKNNRTGDLPIHEFAGGNSWIPEVLRLEYPNLNLDAEFAATRDAALGMLQQQSATMAITSPIDVSAGGDLQLSVRVTNITGHKLPTGYPEGRRMWLQVLVRDGLGVPIFESGAYDVGTGELTHDAQAKIYRAEPGVWDFNGTGSCDITNTQGNPIFHFALNNCVVIDNRIPPLGFVPNAETTPVGYTYPETAPGSGVLVNYDDTAYTVPIPAGTTGPLEVSARLLYQTTSKEYVEFLRDEAVTNNFPDDCIERSSGFPTQTRGEILEDMWTRHGRSAPVDMVTEIASVPVVVGPTCGDGVLDPGETCDPPASCPTACSDGVACTTDTLVGSAATCTAVCDFAPITICSMASDGCCPTACNANNDADCSASCGNGTIEAGETCDPPGACPTACDDNVACTVDTLTGSAANCNAACSFAPITMCDLTSDGCCPAGCTAVNDVDCSASCGNGTIEPGETCDPPDSCPTDCDDDTACTFDTLTGSAANCNAECSFAPITACEALADGCCPAGCTDATDADCQSGVTCGNGVLEADETCDPPSSCPTECDDADACTTDTLEGAPDQCDAACISEAIPGCGEADIGSTPADMGSAPDVGPSSDTAGPSGSDAAGSKGGTEGGCCRTAGNVPIADWWPALFGLLVALRRRD